MLGKQVEGRSNRNIKTKRMLGKDLIFLLNVIDSFPKENKKQEFLPSRVLANWHLLVRSIMPAEIKAKSNQNLKKPGHLT